MCKLDTDTHTLRHFKTLRRNKQITEEQEETTTEQKRKGEIFSLS